MFFFLLPGHSRYQCERTQANHHGCKAQDKRSGKSGILNRSRVLQDSEPARSCQFVGTIEKAGQTREKLMGNWSLKRHPLFFF